VTLAASLCQIKTSYYSNKKGVEFILLVWIVNVRETMYLKIKSSNLLQRIELQIELNHIFCIVRSKKHSYYEFYKLYFNFYKYLAPTEVML
jgi:hypothetical protein